MGIGEKKCFDIAFVYGRDEFPNDIPGITAMKSTASEVQKAYDANTYGWKTNSCTLGSHDENGVADILKPSPVSNKFVVYPNPSTGIFTIENHNPTHEMVLTNALGKTIQSIAPNQKNIDIKNQPCGVYFLHTEQGTIRILKL